MAERGVIDAVEAAADVLFGGGAQWSGADERSGENSVFKREGAAAANSSGVHDDEEEEELECRVCRGEAVRFMGLFVSEACRI